MDKEEKCNWVETVESGHLYSPPAAHGIKNEDFALFLDIFKVNMNQDLRVLHQIFEIIKKITNNIDNPEIIKLFEEFIPGSVSGFDHRDLNSLFLFYKDFLESMQTRYREDLVGIRQISVHLSSLSQKQEGK